MSDRRPAYLESAAAALTGDPAVQFRLGVALAVLVWADQAQKQFQKLTEMLETGKSNPDLAEKVAIAEVRGTPKSE